MASAKMLSVIVPVYNVKKQYLSECFESILGQDFSDYELIIVDDGANRDIHDFIDSYDFREADTVVIHQENKGVAAARNAGLAAASGRFVTFVDSDDTIEKGCFSDITEYADAHGLQVLMFGLYRDFKKRRVPFSPYLCDIAHFTDAQRQEVLYKCLVGILPFFVAPPASADAAGSACAKLYDREFLASNDLRYTEGLARAEDMEFNFRVFDAATSVGYRYRFHYIYRQIETSATYEYRKDGIEVFTAALNAIHDYLVSSGKPDLFFQVYYMRCMFFFLESMDMDYMNPNNPAPFRERLNALAQKSTEEPYASAFANLTKEHLTFARRIPLFLIRHRMFRTLVIFYKTYGLLGR